MREILSIFFVVFVVFVDFSIAIESSSPKYETGTTFEWGRSPISEMSTLIATERMTSINSISEFSNTIISGSTTPTSIKTSSFDANTQTNEIETNTLRIISNYVSTYQSVFGTTTATDIHLSGSFVIPIQTMTDTFTMTGYTLFSYNEIISPSKFETSTFDPQTVSETSISLSIDTLSESLLLTLRVSSGSLIATDSSEFSILSMTISPSYVGDSYIPSLITLFSVPSLTSGTTNSSLELTNISRVSNFYLTTETVITPITATVDSSAVNTVLNSKIKSLLSISENNSRVQQIETNTESQLMCTTFINQKSYSSKIEETSFSSYQDFSETSLTLSKISLSSQLSSSIIDNMDHFIYTINTLITSYFDDTKHSFADFTGGFQTFSRDYAASASTSFIQTTVHYSSFQTTEYHATKPSEFTSYVTTSFNESNIDSVATGMYSTKIATSGKSYMPTSVKPYQTQLASMNDVQSIYLEAYSQSTNEVFSSEISEYMLSSLQSASLLLQFVTQPNASGVETDMKTTSMSTVESQSGKIDLSNFTNPSSILISNVLSNFKTKWVTATINFNSKTMPSMIKPSSQQKNSGNSNIEIDASFKDSLFSFGSGPGSHSSNYPVMTSLSSGIVTPTRTLSPNTVQSGLDEINKNIIFITTMSAVLSIIVVILLIIFAKVFMTKNNTKPRKEDDDISWSNKSIQPKTAFPNDLFLGKNIYPLVHTSSAAFKKHPYEHNWNDIV